MSLRVCPIAPVLAPAERVWSSLSSPANFALWWDGETGKIEPEGDAQPGQCMQWNVDLLVERVDSARHALDVMTSLPLRIIIFSHVTCTRLDPSSSQIASQQLYRSVASALLRLKTAAEGAA